MNYFTRKKPIGVISITLLLCILECFVIFNKEKNAVSESLNEIELLFSHKSGFYDDDFELILSADHGTIYYTLDGSEPDTNSLVYNAPIHITDISSNENVYATRTDVSTGFLADRINEYSPDYRYQGFTSPDYPIDKAVVVRAVVYYDWFHHSEIKTETYFVDYSQKEGYDKMNILSIVTDPDHLFDYDTGIYVTGAAYDEYWEHRLEEDNPNWIDTNWMWWPANYRNRGSEWERAASCQFFDTDRQLLLNQNCGIRIHGGFTRAQNPKSLNLYARDASGYDNRFLYTLFDETFYPSSLTLMQGGNDYIAQIMDPLFAQLIDVLDIASLDYKPYVMFLNGEYWGVYWLCEKYDDAYLSYHYDVLEENIIIIKNGQLDTGDETDYRLYENMLTLCTTSDLTKEENYNKVCNLIDIENYIDYFASMIYAGRYIDWPNSNFALWRTKATEEGHPYSDGKWRWMVFDMNSGGMTADVSDMDSIEYAMENDQMFKNLMTNDTFRQKFIYRIRELGDTIFDYDLVKPKIDAHVTLMREPLQMDQKRFYGTSLDETFMSTIESIETFFATRNDCMNEIIKKYE